MAEKINPQEQGVEPGSETDRLLDAATRRIGNEPSDDGTFANIEETDTPSE